MLVTILLFLHTKAKESQAMEDAWELTAQRSNRTVSCSEQDVQKLGITEGSHLDALGNYVAIKKRR